MSAPLQQAVREKRRRRAAVYWQACEQQAEVVLMLEAARDPLAGEAQALLTRLVARWQRTAGTWNRKELPIRPEV